MRDTALPFPELTFHFEVVVLCENTNILQMTLIGTLLFSVIVLSCCIAIYYGDDTDAWG